MPQVDNDNLLLPRAFKTPRWIVLTGLLPQLLLLILNISAWSLCSGEMSQMQKERCMWVLGYELMLLAAMAVSAAVHRSKNFTVNYFHAIPALVLHIGYLWLVMTWLQQLLPETVALWILPPTKVIYHQFALIMPGLFYSAALLSGFDVKLSRGKDIGVTLSALVLLPAGWYMVLVLFGRLFRRISFPDIVMTVFFVASIAFVIMALLRLLIMLYNALMKSKAGKYVFLFVVGLAAPIGGLLLNAHIPFPYDFQAAIVYVLAVLNGVVLLLPSDKDSMLGTVSWLLRGMMYPFSLFFFVVFLPFLPLSLPAMFFFGSGILLLAPTMLFITHTRYIFEQGSILVGSYGRVRVVLAFAAMFAVMPSVYTATALLDKQSLMAGVHAVYSPDLSTDAVAVHPGRVRRGLERLDERKAGIFLPFLTDYYNHIVFGDMVLPDYKMKEVYTAFVGEEMPITDSGNSIFGSLWSGRNRRGRRQTWGSRTTPPDRNVDLVSVAKTNAVMDGYETTMLTLSMQNRGAAGAEYVSQIKIPSGVFVSDFWLKVEDEQVPGRIFERKAAEWVYHMIRDTTRRDPGLLVYQNDNLLKFNVFPFTSKQERKAGITFAYPSGMHPEVEIGGMTVRLTEADDDPSDELFEVAGDSGRFAIVSQRTASSLPSIKREQYFHFILDRSANAEPDLSYMREQVEKVLSANPEITNCSMAMANYEHADYGGFYSPEDILININTEVLPFRGGLCAERVIKSELLEYRRDMPVGESGLPMAPVFVVVGSRDKRILESRGLQYFADIAPDMEHYYAVAEEGGLVRTHMITGETDRQGYAVRKPADSVLLRAGEKMFVCSAQQGGVISLPDGLERLMVYKPTEAVFEELDKLNRIQPARFLSDACVLMSMCRQTEFAPPSKDMALRGIVGLSRKTRLLSPLTSYIVVENSAQWKMLEKSEKKALKADSTLEFDEHVESPEPSVLFLLPFAAILYWRFRRRRVSISASAG